MLASNKLEMPKQIHVQPIFEHFETVPGIFGQVIAMWPFVGWNIPIKLRGDHSAILGLSPSFLLRRERRSRFEAAISRPACSMRSPSEFWTEALDLAVSV